jgi:hypothetical protein
MKRRVVLILRNTTALFIMNGGDSVVGSHIFPLLPRPPRKETSDCSATSRRQSRAYLLLRHLELDSQPTTCVQGNKPTMVETPPPGRFGRYFLVRMFVA